MDIHDVIADIKGPAVATEAFGTGTAAVVSPVNKIPLSGRGDRHRETAASAYITQQLYDVLHGHPVRQDGRSHGLGCPSEINHTPEQGGGGEGKGGRRVLREATLYADWCGDDHEHDARKTV